MPPPHADPFADLLPLSEVARRIPSRHSGRHMNAATIYRWVKSGKLPAVKIGRTLFVRESELVKLIEPRRVATAKKVLDSQKARQKSQTWSSRVLRDAGMED
jgi:excisionase family DNA binding protein